MDWLRAYKLFKRCYELQPSYDIAANLGQVAVKAGKPAEGATYLWRSLRNFPLSEKAERRRALELMFQIAKKSVATVTLTTDPPDAQLLIDGDRQDRSPDGLVFLDAGKHILTAEAPGYEPYSQSVNASAGTEVILDFTLQRSSGVTIDADAEAAARPAEPPETEPAEPEPAPEPAAEPGPVAPSTSPQPSSVEDTTEPESTQERSLLIPLLVGGGVTAVGLTLGVVYMYSANDTETRADNLDHKLGGNSTCVEGQETDEDRCDRLQDLAETVDSQRNLSYLGFGIAGAAAIATAAYVFWPTEQKRSGRVRPGVSVGAEHAFLSLSGRF